MTGLTGNVSLTTLHLSWNPPEMPNGIITNYEIYFKINESTSFHNASLISTSDSPMYTISNLAILIKIDNIIVIAYTKVGPGPSTSFNKTFTTLGEPREFKMIGLI